MPMHRLIILCFLFTFTGAADDPDHISINCGGAAAVSGRKWGGDAAPKGSSKASTVKGELITAVDPVPYSTARISRSQFSYSFHLTPGQKYIRLHFNPAYYRGFESFHDLFTVEAGPFTLLANFSASITARALSLNIIAKEFCIIIQENQPLNIVFSPESSQSKHTYAFINGIEIISVPSTISYCHGGDSGVRVLGEQSVIYINNATALERVYHQNMKWGSVSFGHDMFGIWASILQGNGNKARNLIWRVSVDVGFRYLVRVHLFEVGLQMDFMLMIDNEVALTSVDMLQQSENQSLLWYNYMVMVQGKKREAKHRISISLHSQHELVDRQGPIEGFEVFKLSNHDLSLATPNPLPPPGDSPPHSTPTLLHSLLGHKNAIATVVFAKIFLVNIIVHQLHKLWGTADSSEEENEPSARAKRPACRHFSLAEIQSATDNFHSRNFIGRGGFGNVHRGLIDNGREIVAIKRLKRHSSQGDNQFWTEVEMLSKLRHVNLVPLLGFCAEQQERIIVYEYMPCGTLADHLFKLAQKSHDYIPLSWKQRLKICIGAGRALDYLHTGHGIIHRDVKSSNILLDEKFVAKVSDFGLAKTGFGTESQSQHSTQVKGTRGYLDPNYCETHKPTKNSDTYSFGVVLLEVLCGRRALEQYDEEDKCRLTTWAIDNISKGQIDHIVLQSLIRDISPDSLKTFVKVAKRCLHDEPKKRPAISHVVMKLEFALQQQEKAESLDPNEKTSMENLFSSTDKYDKKSMNFMVPNEKTNIVDALPQMENATSLAPNEMKNVTDAMPCNGNDRTISSSLKPMASSSNVRTVTFLPSEKINSTMINSGRQGGRISMMLRMSRKLWPWKSRKPSNKTDLVGTSVSAPISRRTSNITMDGNTITNKRNDGMILTPLAESSNEKEQHSQTMWVMDNISKGQVDHIVAPTLRGESSRYILAVRKHQSIIVTENELALQQQEKAESLDPNEKTSIENLFSSTDKYAKKSMNFMVPNEKTNIVDTLPQMENATSLAPNEMRNVTDAMPCNGNDRTISSSLKPMASSSNVRTVTFLPSEKINSTMINSGGQGGRISMMLRMSRKLWPWKSRKPSNKTDLVGTSVSAPISRRTSNITMDGNAITNKRNDGMILTPLAESSNEKEQHSQTMWVMDDISKGQVDHIVAPTLRGESSPDSQAERWLHDEPKNQPTTMHIVKKNELALQQQEMADSLPSKERTSVESASSSTGTTQKAIVNFPVRNEKINVSDDAPSMGGQVLPHPRLRVFSLAELKFATRNFRSDSVLGEGGFGKVYKGWLEDRATSNTTIIAVKKLNSESMQGFQEWQSEVNFLGRLSHPNLVKLLGYGFEDSELLLVYEFMAKGSLENHLFRRGASVQPLPWDIRLKILIGAARGVAFLHASDKKVIYRDFKASNILLDGSYHAKLSDFGLAKLGPSDSYSHVSTQVMGTYGYAAPEYVATGHLYVKSDVYGFGVVMVEMLTGLRALDTNRPSGQCSLVDWIKPHLSDRRKLKRIIDVLLEGRYPRKSAIQIAQLALQCLESEPKYRPSMQEVVETLERID